MTIMIVVVTSRFLYMTQAARDLQSHDLLAEGIKLWITYIVF